MTEELNGDDVHLDTIALLALADYLAGVSVFGERKEAAWKSAVKFGKSLLNNVEDNAAEDVIDRAYDFVVDWIAANRRRFSKEAAPCFGRIESDQVLVIATELRRALEDNGFSYVKCRKGFADRDYMESFTDVNGTKRNQYLRSIQGVKVRVFIFPMKVENLYPPEDDFME